MGCEELSDVGETNSIFSTIALTLLEFSAIAYAIMRQSPITLSPWNCHMSKLFLLV